MAAARSAGLGAGLLLIDEPHYFFCNQKKLFDRQNLYCAEEFSSSWRKPVLKATDKLISGIAINFPFGGLQAIALAYEATRGSMAPLPAYLFILFLAGGA